MAEDAWSPGSSSEPWRKITALQQFPGIVGRPATDLSAACGDDEPLVRAAACLAIGRAAGAKNLPHLLPRLEDEVPLVRRCALWALVQIDSRGIKEPLLKVIGSWPEIQTIYGDPDLARYGLPGDLVSAPLEQRRQWLQDSDESAWRIRFDNSRYAITADGRIRTHLLLHESEIDAGQPIPVQLRIKREGGAEPVPWSFDRHPGYWSAVDWELDGGPSFHDHRLFFPRDLQGEVPRLSELPPNEVTELALVVRTDRRPVPPGIYLFHAFEADAPVFIRVRRSQQDEARIDEWIERIPDPAAVKQLGEQRVREAVLALIHAFRESGGANKFAIAEALGRIGDPAAVPALLADPSFRSYDVIGDTSQALTQIGTAADPFYEEHILQWEQRLEAGEVAALRMSLGLLGPRGSAATHSARLQLIEALVDGRHDQPEVLLAAVVAVAPRDPQPAAEAIWAVRDRPQIFARMIATFQRGDVDQEMASTIAETLWKRAKQEPLAESAAQDALVQLVAHLSPDQLFENDWSFTSATQATRFLKAARLEEHDVRGAIRRVEAYLEGRQSPAAKLALAHSYSEIDDYEAAAELLREVLADAQTNEQQEVSAHLCLSEALLQLGLAGEALSHAKNAQRLAKPNHAYDSCNDTPGREQRMLDRDIDQHISFIADVPANPEWHWRDHTMQPYGEVKLHDRQAFYVDHLRYLRRWDPLTREGSRFYVVPNSVREFIPVDQHRLFIIFEDGSSALHQLGASDPLWEGPDNTYHRAFLTASPQAITVATNEGKLLTLAPTSGQVRWTINVDLMLREKHTPRVDQKLVQQFQDGVLIPDQATPGKKLSWVDLASGRKRWTYESALPIFQAAFLKDTVLLAGRDHVEAVSLNDGERIWQADLQANANFPHLQLSLVIAPDQEQAYVAVQDQVIALDSATGDERWRWRWRPLAGTVAQNTHAMPTLLPVENALLFLINWDLAAPGPNARTDVVQLGDDGEVLLHSTMPQRNLITGRHATDAFVADETLVFRFGHWWQLWQWRLQSR